MAKKKSDIIKLVQEAPKATRVLPTSEALVHRSYGLLEKLMLQLEVQTNSGAPLSREDVQMLRTAQQMITELRKDERDADKSGADEDLDEEAVLALLEAKGIKVLK